MSQKEYIMIGLLAVSLIVNFITWNQLQDVRNSQHMYAHQNEVYGLRNEISSVRNEIDQIVKANAWIQETSFEVDEGNSSFYKVLLQGQWTFSELRDGQTPYLLLKEKDGEWKEISMNKFNGLTYGTDLELSAQKNYEYKIAAEGSLNKSTDIRRIPYEMYGIPQLEVKYGSNYSGNNQVSFNFGGVLDPNPVKEMAPERIYLEVQRNGQVEKQIPFTADDHGNNNTWEANWTLEDRKLLNEYKLFTVTEFKNGFEQRKEVEQFNRESVEE